MQEKNQLFVAGAISYQSGKEDRLSPVASRNRSVTVCKSSSRDKAGSGNREPLKRREEKQEQIAENKVRGASSEEGWKAAQFSVEEMCT